MPQRADVFAEGRPVEQRIEQQCGDEIAHNQPRRPPGRAPQVVAFVHKEEEREKRRRQPFVAQAGRPMARRLDEAAQSVPRQHEGARHAEGVAKDE